jgi:hypothetical protein
MNDTCILHVDLSPEQAHLFSTSPTGLTARDRLM